MPALPALTAFRTAAFTMSAGLAVAGCGDSSEPASGVQQPAATAEGGLPFDTVHKSALSTTEHDRLLGPPSTTRTGCTPPAGWEPAPTR